MKNQSYITSTATTVRRNSRVLYAAACLIAMATGTSQASLIVNGDFTAPKQQNSTGVNASEIDGGWIGLENAGRGGFDVSGGVATTTIGSLDSGWWMGQVNTVGSESGSSLTLTFDWTAPVGATLLDLNLYYSVMGWTTTTGDTTGTTDYMVSNNSGSAAQTLGSDAGFRSYDLSSGVTSTGTVNPADLVFAGTAGSTIGASITIDLSTNPAASDNIADMDFFGIAFGFEGGALGEGGILDNVAVSTIPEPSSAVLLGFGAMVALVLRCRTRK